MRARQGPAPRATYRVQLHAGFGFGAAIEIVPYLAELGFSHLYCSPILQAVAGSTHGYDVVDHGRLNAELGSDDGFARLTDALRAHGMGLVLDIVPNHMAIAEANRWWWDVLEHGPASRHAAAFDVDWEPPESRLRNVILLPVLPDHYGRVLEAGEIRLVRDGGRLLVCHADRRFPTDPVTLAPLVGGAAARCDSEELAFIGEALAALPASTTSDAGELARRQRDADVLEVRLSELAADPAVAQALDAAVASVNADPDALDALLEAQQYRLAYWRASSRDLGYRRFFDINELIGLRMEDESVFRDTHALVLSWIADGRVDGLRIDHPDGLRDPAAYFARLRASAPDAWIVAEKILADDELLPRDWPVDGTTGYRFCNVATGLLVDPAGQASLTDLYARFAGEPVDWRAVELEARREVLSEVLGSDVNRLTDLFLAVCEANRRYRDLTRHELQHALREVAASLPVYRTYVRAGAGQVTDADRRLVDGAVAAAADRRPDLDPELFVLLGRILRLEVTGRLEGELAMRFQQLTPAAMAKGVEDTAFYRYLRFTPLNEVGGDPGRFGVEPDAFHEAMAGLAEQWPSGMLTTSTHDTKRSEDVRARLALLADIPGEWAAAVQRLAALGRAHRSGPALPSAADEYLLLQTLVGAWPISADRMVEYLGKASHEAKLRTSWTAPNEEYHEALDQLVRGCLGDPAFVAEVESFTAPLVEPGRHAALAQLLLKLTAPGVPDVYQGTELWDLSLVDPDNRRPVDFALRHELLVRGRDADAEAAWAGVDEGLPKLWLLQRALELRTRRPELFGPEAGYVPVSLHGSRAGAAVAFCRGDSLVTLVPVRPLRIARDGWADTHLRLPDGTWRDVLAEDEREGEVLLADLLAGFPVALLERVVQ